MSNRSTMSLPQSQYLHCSHCRSEFIASERQLKRARSAEGKAHRFYCSLICQTAGSAENRRRPMPYTGICKQCGKAWASRQPHKAFCSLKCYIASPEAKARLRSMAHQALGASVLKTTGKAVVPRIEMTCLNCGTKRLVRHSSNQKYCNRRCYRQYMAGRFDRWVASPQSVALPQSFDEFLSQEELPCLVEGCNWVGLCLGNHVNFAHGIPAAEFKRAAGFNIKTGLVTPAMSERLSQWPRIHEGIFGGESRDDSGKPSNPPLIRGYRSLEGREHAAKALAIRMIGPSEIPPRVCIGCGVEFQPGPISWGSKYCSIGCRDQWYRENHRTLRFWMKCGKCGKDFQGSVDQNRRWERGSPVFCNTVCRQSNNGAKRKRRPK